MVHWPSMTQSLAIHHSPGSFSDRWLEVCEERGIDHCVVDCYSSDIISQLNGRTALLWHWSQMVPTDLLMARNVIESAQLLGLNVFPSAATCWHFDDKVAQKYLLEAAGAPLAPTTILYERQAALDWSQHASFPVVFKLRRGAGSSNVRLVRDKKDAERLIKRAFGRGFAPAPGVLAAAGSRLERVRQKGHPRVPKGGIVVGTRRLSEDLRRVAGRHRATPAEQGYFYAQDFLPGNSFDTRVTVIGHRGFAFTRNVRKNDFRASGSGSIDYDQSRIDPRCLAIAFDVTRRIGSQSCAFDFAFDQAGCPLVLEISYCYQAKAVHDCGGYWDAQMGWHEGHIWPEDAILEDLLAVG